MPVLQNSIGAFEFLDMEGNCYPRQQQKELIERAGVDGTGARKTGLRGKPFDLVTTNYEASHIAAQGKLEDYADLCDDDTLITIVKHGVPEGDYMLLEVKERARYAIWQSLGGLVGGEECCHEVIWTFIA